MIHVLAVDDHVAIGQGTKSMLEQTGEFQVTMISSATEALQYLREHSYDVILLDIQMPEIDGIELARLIHQQFDIKVVMYSGYELDEYFNELVKAGVVGMVSKSSSSSHLIEAIRCAVRGQVLLPLPLFRELRRTIVQPPDAPQRVTIHIGDIEKEILIGVMNGQTNQEIANTLYVSKRTVENRLTVLFERLGVQSRVRAVERAKELNLI